MAGIMADAPGAARAARREAPEGSGGLVPQNVTRLALVRAVDELTAYRIPLFRPDFPIILLYSEKSGSTALVKWFFHQLGLLDEALAFNSWVHAFENQVFKRAPDYRRGLRGALVAGDRTLLKFTREPYQRAVSSFLMLSSHGLARNRGHFAHGEWRKIRAFKYGDPQAGGGISFVDFLHFVRACGPQVGRVNAHFAQQHGAAEAAFRIAYSDLADMTAVLARLERRHGLKPSPGLPFSSGHHRAYEDAVTPGAAHLVVTETTFATARRPHYASFYDEATKALVQDVYRDDFREYGYSTELSARPEDTYQED